MKKILTLLIVLGLCLHAAAQSKVKSTFPFQVQQLQNMFVISAEVEEAPLYPKYATLFRKYKLSGNGQCWADLITQILQKKSPGLLGKIQLDPEAGMFSASVQSEADQIRFLNIVVPIFSNLKVLEGYIKKADRSRFDD